MTVHDASRPPLSPRRHEPTRFVIIDDDPTGTQTMADVDVVLEPDESVFREFLASDQRALCVIANTRSMDESGAVSRLREILAALAAAGGEGSCSVILRGDSTLRGHVFAETDVLAGPDTVVLFVPAFPEAGRTTRDGIQWLRDENGVSVPVHRTEFARDPHFAYSSARLEDWVAERGGGRPATMVPLTEIRRRGGQPVEAALVSAQTGAVVIPEAETRADLQSIDAGLRAAQRRRSVVVRAASSFAAIHAGIAKRRLDHVDVPPPGRVLVVCGSHTAASSRQLGRLSEQTGVSPVTIDGLEDDAGIPGREVDLLRASLDRHGIAVAMTSRALRRTTDRGVAIMSRLVTTVAALTGEFDAVVAKGGITSAEVARVALGVRRARVLGQVVPGVALWQVALPHGAIPYLVVPGNVGGSGLLCDVVGLLGVRDRRQVSR